jgi:hypothetical protein
MDQTSDRTPGRWGGFSVSQWVVLAALGGILLAIGATLVLVLRAAGLELPDVQSTTVADSDTELAEVPRDAIPKADGLYWPPEPMPLATPNTPGDLLWWDARFAYRHAVRLDATASQAEAGTWARVILDGERAQREGKMRDDAADLRTLVWDGQRWREIPRQVRLLSRTTGWEVVFQLQGPTLVSPEGGTELVYSIYYGYPSAGAPLTAESGPDTPSLLLELAAQESVEWGPEVVWQAGASTVQTYVSLDGRIVIQVHPGALQEETRVRLRTVPLSERSGHGPLPDFELHADPPPGSPGPDNVIRWDPPLLVTINWSGLPVDPVYLESWTYFTYDTSQGLWRSVPVEFDPRHGVIQITTDQI